MVSSIEQPQVMNLSSVFRTHILTECLNRRLICSVAASVAVRERPRSPLFRSTIEREACAFGGEELTTVLLFYRRKSAMSAGGAYLTAERIDRSGVRHPDSTVAKSPSMIVRVSDRTVVQDVARISITETECLRP